MSKLLECKNLSVSFDGRPIIKDLSFTVNEKDFICIIGENGTGKSTLTNAMLGLIPITSGSIELHGICKSDIGYLPQKLKVENNFPASVYEIVMSGFVGKSFFNPFYTKSQKCKATDSIELLSIDSIKSRPFTELSGGQQQRVLLARAICAAEKLVLLDEPVTGLDAQSSDSFYKLIMHLNSEHGVAVIMVSHDIERSVKFAEKVLHLGTNDYFFGTVDQYKATDYYKNFLKDAK